MPIQLLIGPETAHKFHPDSLKQFMTFLVSHANQGRPTFPEPNKLKFVTYTLKYNHCDWLTIEEQLKPYELTEVEAEVDSATKKGDRSHAKRGGFSVAGEVLRTLLWLMAAIHYR